MHAFRCLICDSQELNHGRRRRALFYFVLFCCMHSVNFCFFELTQRHHRQRSNHTWWLLRRHGIYWYTVYSPAWVVSATRIRRSRLRRRRNNFSVAWLDRSWRDLNPPRLRNRSHTTGTRHRNYRYHNPHRHHSWPTYNTISCGSS